MVKFRHTDIKSSETIKADAYRVNNKPESLRLRLHGINYLTSSGRINCVKSVTVI